MTFEKYWEGVSASSTTAEVEWAARKAWDASAKAQLEPDRIRHESCTRTLTAVIEDLRNQLKEKEEQRVREPGFLPLCHPDCRLRQQLQDKDKIIADAIAIARERNETVRELQNKVEQLKEQLKEKHDRDPVTDPRGPCVGCMRPFGPTCEDCANAPGGDGSKKSELSFIERLNREKRARVYYQNIVYDVCNILDAIEGRHTNHRGPWCIVPGTLETPATEVQEAMKRVAARLRDTRRQDRPGADAMKCSACGGYSLYMSEGAYNCRCENEPDAAQAAGDAPAPKSPPQAR